VAITKALSASNPAFSEYPTLRLDSSAVLDNSIRWERYKAPQATTQQQQMKMLATKSART
jgi:hypothetical protein